jgi:hypothetical protein
MSKSKTKKPMKYANKHGILTNAMTGYDWINPSELLEELIIEYQPKTTSQRILVELLAFTYLRILRCARFETEIIKEALNPPEFSDSILIDFDLPKPEIIEVNDQAVITHHTFEKLEIIYLRYEPKLYQRLNMLKKLLRDEVLNHNNHR